MAAPVFTVVVLERPVTERRYATSKIRETPVRWEVLEWL